MKSAEETAQAVKQKFGDRAEWVASYRAKKYPTPQGRAHWAAVLRLITKAPAPAPQHSRKGWTTDPSKVQWHLNHQLAVYQTRDGYEWHNLSTQAHGTEPKLSMAQQAAERTTS